MSGATPQPAAIRAALACGDPRCACSRGRHVHCPAHADRHPSFAVDARHGRVLVVCRAGCDQRDVLDALRARGLWSTGTAQPRLATREPAIHELALELARSQPWTRPGVVERYRAADQFRRAMRRVHAIRTAATDDTPATWDRLARAAMIETAALALEAVLDEAA